MHPSDGHEVAHGNSRGLDANLKGAPQQLEYRAIADRLAADGVHRVLDWGCGWGQISDLLVQRGLDVASCDYRPGHPEEVKPLERYPHLEVHLTPDPVRLPYEDASFDAVLSCGVLEHVAYPAASLSELRRVLRPGGRLYVFKLPNRFSYLEAVARVAGMYHHGQLPDDRLYTRRSAVELVRMSGFEVEEAALENLLPLTVGDRVTNRFPGAVWGANRALSRVPGLRALATNVTVIGRAVA